jgi:hypothetical protein
VFVNNLDTLLRGFLGKEGVFETHTTKDFDAVAAQINLEAGSTEGRRALDDGDVVTEAGEPEGQRVAGHACARDEDAHGAHFSSLLTFICSCFISFAKGLWRRFLLNVNGGIISGAKLRPGDSANSYLPEPA